MTALYKSLLLLRNDAIELGHGELAKIYQLSLVRLAGDEVAQRLVDIVRRKKDGKCGNDSMKKLWEVYYWNKHRYEWVWIGQAEGVSKQEAIQSAKSEWPEFVARGDVLKVEEYANHA